MGYKIDKDFLFNVSKEILACHSPSGYCSDVIKIIEDYSTKFGFSFEKTNKGCGIITLEGKSNDNVVALAAHVDTLGAMVRGITNDGNLTFTLVGGPILPTLDSEYCIVKTRDGKEYTGTFLSTSPSIHVYEDAKSKSRDPKNMIIRIDEKVKNKDDVKNLGISAGDYIFIDPKTTITESGFIKSRFIDDKGSVAALLTLMELIKRENIKLKNTVKILISIYEEVGHGLAFIPEDVKEMIAVDMGCIGEDLSCTEYEVSICAKDSNGPYDYNMTSKLIKLAKENNIPHAVDIYPFYGSDVGAALKAGNDVRGALIGPGVHASHGMERTHFEALESTIELLIAYIVAE